VAGAPLELSVLACAAHLGRGPLTTIVSALAVGGLARTASAGSDRIEPYHDRVRNAILACLSPEEMASNHRRIASALEQVATGDEHVELALVHLMGCGRTSDATRCAERAARLAASALAFSRAAELYSLALDLVPDSHAAAEKRLELRLGLAEALA